MTIWNKKLIDEKCIEFNIKFVNDYYNSKEKQCFICKCGNQFNRKWSNVLLGQINCLECSNNILIMKNKERTKESFLKLIEYIDKNDLGFNVLTNIDDYKNNKQKLDVICKCGNKFNPSLGNIISGKVRQCTLCRNKKSQIKRRLDKDVMTKYIESNGYRIKDYKYNNGNYFLVSCGLHDYYWVNYSNFYHSKTRCKVCNISKGENEISKILDNHNIGYEREKVFNDLIGSGGRNLRFDFYIEELNTLIEFDGEQHFVPKFDMTDDDFKRQQSHDVMKDNYCLNKNINLIRIKYNQNIYNTLKKNSILNKAIPR